MEWVTKDIGCFEGAEWGARVGRTVGPKVGGFEIFEWIGLWEGAFEGAKVEIGTLVGKVVVVDLDSFDGCSVTKDVGSLEG